jgi:hypothetical protein
MHCDEAPIALIQGEPSGRFLQAILPGPKPLLGF